MASQLRVEPAQEEDLPRLMEIVAPAFGPYSYAQLVGDIDTPENRKAMAERHLHAWREHTKCFKHTPGIKCVHVDPVTQKETIISSATWTIYDRPRSEEEYLQPLHLLGASWIEEGEKREQAMGMAQSLIDGRIRWMGGRPHGVLMFMATDNAYQRMGAATKVVQWGLDRCRELAIPAYLQSSAAGVPVYERLGYEVVDEVYLDGHPLKVMIWWPPGTKEEEKKPAIPGYGKT